jgi:hypothetical protein
MVGRGNLLFDVSLTNAGSPYHNYAPAGYKDADFHALILAGAGGDVTLTGLKSDGPVKMVVLSNFGGTSNNLIIKDQDAGSSPGNRFYTGTSADLTIDEGDLARFVHTDLGGALPGGDAYWVLSEIWSGWQAGNALWAQSDDPGALISGYWHRMAAPASSMPGRGASGGFRMLADAEIQHLLRANEADVLTDTPSRTFTWGNYTGGGTDSQWRQAYMLILNATGSGPLYISGFKAEYADSEFVHKKTIFNLNSIYPVVLLLNHTHSNADNRIRGGQGSSDAEVHFVIPPYSCATILYSPKSGHRKWHILNNPSRLLHQTTGITAGTYSPWPNSQPNLSDWIRCRSIDIQNSSAGDAIFSGLIWDDDPPATTGELNVEPQKVIRNSRNSNGDLVLKHGSGSVTSSQRIYSPRGVDERLRPGEAGILSRNKGQDFWEFSRVDPGNAEQTLTDGATITYDVTGNRVLDWTNPVAGQRGVIRVIQDGTPPRTLTYSRASVAADVDFAGAVAPVLTNAVGAVDVLEWYDDGSKVHLRAFSLDSK